MKKRRIILRIAALTMLTVVISAYLFFGTYLPCVFADAGGYSSGCGFPFPTMVISDYCFGAVDCLVGVPNIIKLSSYTGVYVPGLAANLLIWLPLILLCIWLFRFLGRHQKL